MSKGIYIGVNNISRKVKSMYKDVENVARRIGAAYTGVNGVSRQFFGISYFRRLWEFGIEKNGNTESIEVNSCYAGFEEDSIALRFDVYQSSADDASGLNVYARIVDNHLGGKVLSFDYIQGRVSDPGSAYTDFAIIAYDNEGKQVMNYNLGWYTTEQTGTKNYTLPETTAMFLFLLSARKRGSNSTYWILNNVKIGDTKYT